LASVGAQDQHSLSFAGLDLSEAQRTALRSILTTAKKTGESQADTAKNIDAVLTPAQQRIVANRKQPGAAAQAAQASAIVPPTTPAAFSPSAPAGTSAGAAVAANVRNQAAAAHSVRINALLAQVLSTNPPAPIK
jgi:hypothetical protein